MPFIALSTGKKTTRHVRRMFKKWFDRSGQSQTVAGAAIEWQQQTVSAYFAGEQHIDLERAIVWCRHFGYDFSDLLQHAPRPKPTNPRLQKLINKWNGLNKREQNWFLNAPVGRKR